MSIDEIKTTAPYTGDLIQPERPTFTPAIDTPGAMFPLGEALHITPVLGFFPIYPDVVVPSFATSGSACFDIRAYLPKGTQVKIFSGIKQHDYTIQEYIQLDGLERALIPTGLILDIPYGYSVRLHPRSGLAIKQGAALANCEGVIDADYVEPVFVAVCNLNQNEPLIIKNGDRICQAELVKNQEFLTLTLTERPKTKTTRTGGFGSTGIK